MYDTRASTPRHYVPSSGFRSATLATYATAVFASHTRDSQGRVRHITDELPYGYAPTSEPYDYSDLTKPGVGDTVRSHFHPREHRRRVLARIAAREYAEATDGHPQF